MIRNRWPLRYSIELRSYCAKIRYKSTPLTNLKLIGYKDRYPKLYLFIHPNYISIHVREDQPAFLGTMEKSKEIIDAKKQPLWFFRSIWRLYSALSILAVISATAYYFFVSNDRGIFYTLIGISWVLSIPGLIFVLRPKNQVILSYSKETTSFWKRNSDKIIVAIISIILTLIITYIFGKITN